MSYVCNMNILILKNFVENFSYSLIISVCLLIAMFIAGCTTINNKSSTHILEPFQEIPFTEWEYDQPDPSDLLFIETLGCQLEDLPPIGWKEVNSGLVDILTAEAYETQTASLFQQGSLDYQQNRLENPEKFSSLPELSYEEYFEICNVFPGINFSKYSLLGFHASGTGCSVSFKKNIYQNDKDLTILYQLQVIEIGDCKTTIYDRNLILVPKIPVDYEVIFQDIN